MGYLALKSFWQVDDFDCLEGTPLDAHTAANTQMLRNEANGRGGFYIDAHLSNLVDWTGLCALLSALLWLALIRVYDCDSELIVCHSYFSSPVKFEEAQKLFNNNSSQTRKMKFVTKTLPKFTNQISTILQ